MLCSYYNTPKTEAEIACFCAFCAIKSILGNKAYTKTNKSLISARMFGMAGSALANTQEQDYSTEQLMKKYSKRYHMDNILLELQTNYGLKLYSSHSRGFYLSFSKTIDDLPLSAQKASCHNDINYLRCCCSVTLYLRCCCNVIHHTNTTLMRWGCEVLPFFVQPCITFR